LYRTGTTMMREAIELGGTRWLVVQTFRDGLFLALGTMCPERIRALAELTVGAVDTKHGVFDIPPEDTKTGKPSRRRLPPALAAAVDVWLESYRSAYAPDHDRFWIAKGGGRARPQTLRPAMKIATQNRLGIAVTPQRFRESAATFVIEEMPEHAALASVLLQHTSEQMTRNYQERAEETAAFRRFAKHIDQAQAELEEEMS
jgi:integrase